MIYAERDGEIGRQMIAERGMQTNSEVDIEIYMQTYIHTYTCMHTYMQAGR